MTVQKSWTLDFVFTIFAKKSSPSWIASHQRQTQTEEWEWKRDGGWMRMCEREIWCEKMKWYRSFAVNWDARNSCAHIKQDQKWKESSEEKMKHKWEQLNETIFDSIHAFQFGQTPCYHLWNVCQCVRVSGCDKESAQPACPTQDVHAKNFVGVVDLMEHNSICLSLSVTICKSRTININLILNGFDAFFSLAVAHSFMCAVISFLHFLRLLLGSRVCWPRMVRGTRRKWCECRRTRLDSNVIWSTMRKRTEQRKKSTIIDRTMAIMILQRPEITNVGGDEYIFALHTRQTNSYHFSESNTLLLSALH